MRDLTGSTRPHHVVREAIAQDYAEHADAIRAFHQAWYASRQTHRMTFFEGVPVLKNPLDLWVLQEILWDLRPTLCLETGTAYGGSALYLARIFDRIGEGQVVSIDVEPHETLPRHPRISFVRGSSTDPAVVDAVTTVARTHPRVMVILDADHSAAHVRAELDVYAPLVSEGHFLVVEDTNINGRPVPIDWKGGPGPGPAVDAWLPDHPEFSRELMAERYLLTMHPGGWLRKRSCETA